MRLLAALLALFFLVAACAGQNRAEPPGLFESQGAIDWDRIESRSELAAQSDLVVVGTLVDVADGFVFGASVDDEFGSPEIELLIGIGGDEPLRLLWSYPPGYSLEEIRQAFPIGSRMVVFANRFEVAPSDRDSYHHIGEQDHDHWIWTNPQGLLLEDPDTGELTSYDASVQFVDAPPTGAELEAWLREPLAFEDPELAGFCEYTIGDFDNEPAHATMEAAAESFRVQHSILDGLDLSDGTILLRGQEVGSYEVVPRPSNTFAVETAEWCYPES